MRRKSHYLPALVLAFLLAGGIFPRPAAAVKLVIGRVTALDREAGTMLLEVEDETGKTTVVNVAVEQRKLPLSVGENSVVRAWLSPLKAGDDTRTAGGTTFTAGRIWPAGGGGGSDRTGIRSRLKRAAGGGRGGGRGGNGGNHGR
jgi:hypothetical protein